MLTVYCILPVVHESVLQLVSTPCYGNRTNLTFKLVGKWTARRILTQSQEKASETRQGTSVSHSSINGGHITEQVV